MLYLSTFPISFYELNSWKHVSFLGKKKPNIHSGWNGHINLLAISEEDMPHKKEEKKVAKSNKEYFFKHSTAQNEVIR